MRHAAPHIRPNDFPILMKHRVRRLIRYLRRRRVVAPFAIFCSNIDSELNLTDWMMGRSFAADDVEEDCEFLKQL